MFIKLGLLFFEKYYMRLRENKKTKISFVKNFTLKLHAIYLNLNSHMHNLPQLMLLFCVYLISIRFFFVYFHSAKPISKSFVLELTVSRSLFSN